MLKLSKGKFTTDPERHSGEGIFFSSRAFDFFAILSRGVAYVHTFGDENDYLFDQATEVHGTRVMMQLHNSASRTLHEVFGQFTDGDFEFKKTVIPVYLAKYGDEFLVSRSQAKRVLDGLDKFSIVIFDFAGVDSIGQAFADQIFRVYAQQHPKMTLKQRNANRSIQQMIRHVER